MRPSPTKPLSLIAEVTHRCPLSCVYCSNPIEMKKRADELPTEEWARLFGEAAEMGVVQLHLTGGEPLARNDLLELIAAGRSAGLYTNLITSGIGLTPKRLRALVEGGLDHIQLSMQDVDEKTGNWIAGANVHAQKLEVAKWIGLEEVAFTLNAVVHRHNLSRIPEIIQLAEKLGASRLEIAHVQYYGWAFKNRESLLPSRKAFERCISIVEEARGRLKGKLRIDFVTPDYYAKYPKPCMGGWGKNVILTDPSGLCLPCHSASVIPGLSAPQFKGSSLKWIWEESPAFNLFRGEDWMKEPCRSCERRTQDFGGCRCQAMLLAADAAATNPVCSLSPNRATVDAVVELAKSASPSEVEWSYRVNPG